MLPSQKTALACLYLIAPALMPMAAAKLSAWAFVTVAGMFVGLSLVFYLIRPKTFKEDE